MDKKTAAGGTARASERKRKNIGAGREDGGGRELGELAKPEEFADDYVTEERQLVLPGRTTLADLLGDNEDNLQDRGSRRPRQPQHPMKNNLPHTIASAWAKSPRRTGAADAGWLSLIDHSIDVAAAASALLRLPTIRARLGTLAGRQLTDIDIARLCVMTALHDAGKVNHGFQRKLRGEAPEAGHTAPLWALIGGTPMSEPQRLLRRKIRAAIGVPPRGSKAVPPNRRPGA